MSDLFGNREHQAKLRGFLIRVLGVAIAVGLVVGLGSLLVVKGLGLSSVRVSNLGSGSVGPFTPLPSTALPVPTQSALPLQSNELSPTAGPTAANTGGIYLSASPVFAKAMERINLTGQWPGHNTGGLSVQRFNAGAWADFGVQVEVRGGTFGSYVLTSYFGENHFRVFDPATNTASNVVTVTIQ